MQQAKTFKTLKVRIKDKHASFLVDLARSTNLVWNYVNELSERVIRERGQFLSSYDLHKYTGGSSKMLGLHSQSVQAISDEYVARRKQCKKARLHWRKSSGSRRSLGWIPFKAGAVTWSNGQVAYNGKRLGVWDSYGMSEFDFRSGSFSEDARGRWYFNVAVEVRRQLSTGHDDVGIDLGLKTTATCSDGTKLESGRFYRDLEKSLGMAQRAGKKNRIRAIHAKIAGRRKDALHKFSAALVARCASIVVGDISSQKLAKTTMAKSVFDAGWGQLKTMLEYKCAHAGVIFRVVSESYTTQTCSNCGSLPDSRPKGIAGLGIREWSCSGCGVTHDHDVNAARNILALGHERPVVGISAL